MSSKLSTLAIQWLDTKSFKQQPDETILEADGAVAASPQVPVEMVNLKISRDEIYWAVQTGLKKRILLALQRATGTLWRLYDDGFALEVMTPHRACILPEEALSEVCSEDNNHQLLDTIWEVPLFPTTAAEGHSLVQRRLVPQTFHSSSQ